jgi:hypothetical protein
MPFFAHPGDPALKTWPPISPLVMPGLVPGIHVSFSVTPEHVDGRDQIAAMTAL